MASSGRTSTVALLVDFLERLLEDRAEGRVRTLAEYQLLYPGLETEVEREYRSILDADPSPGSEEQTSAGARRIRYGKFETIRELGRGGQGIVYLARHVRLDKCVALKVLARDMMAEDDILRFEREARLAAQIDHPGLCPVFDFGFEEGEAYLAMQFVPGTTLAAQIESLKEGTQAFARDRIRSAVALIEEVARALHVAHEVGIVHRDIKPSNIMVRPDDIPVVLDFGIARTLDPDRTGGWQWGETIFGTPPYMAPEQFVPDAVPGDRRVDVFALGSVLYELVTLRRAFPGPLQRGTDGRPLRSEPEDPRRLVPRIDRDLSLVISTALAQERANRYLTALDLAEDLRAVQETRPIHARTPSLAHRCRRWTQRNPGLAASIAALFLTLATGLVVSLVLLGMTRAAQTRLVRENYKTSIFAANLSLENDDVASAREQLEACPPDLRGVEWDRLWLLADSSMAALSPGGEVDELVQFVDSPDRFGVLVDGSVRSFGIGDAELPAAGRGTGLARMRALSGGRILAEKSTESGHQLQVLDSAFGRLGQPIPLRGPTDALAATADGTRIAYSDQPGEIVLVREAERVVLPGPADDHVRQLEFSAGGNRLAAVFDGADNPVIVFDVHGRAPPVSIPGVERFVRNFAFSPDGLRLVIATSDFPNAGDVVLSVWDLASENGRALAHSPVHFRSATSLLVHPGGDVFVGTGEGGIHWLSSDLQERLGVLRGHTDAVRSMVLDATGQRLLTASADGSVRIWSTLRPADSHVWEWPHRETRQQRLSVAFDASGDRLVAGGGFGNIDVWNLRNASAARRFQVRDSTTVGFVRGGTEVAYMGCGEQDVLGTVSLTDQPSGPLPELGRGTESTIIDGARSRIIFARRSHGWVRIRHLDDAGEATDLTGLSATPWLLAMSHDGNRIAAVTGTGFHWWDLTDGTSRAIPVSSKTPRPLPNTRMLALDRNGEWLAYAPRLGSEVLLYDLERGSDEPKVLAQPAVVNAIAFSPTESRLAVATADQRVHLWDHVRGAKLLSMAGEATMLTFSDQGDRLAATAPQASVHLWELRGRPAGHPGSPATSDPPRDRPASLAERLLRASRLIPRIDPETIIRDPFHPEEWYRLSLEALAVRRTYTTLHERPLQLGLAHLRLGELELAEEQLDLANERALQQFNQALPAAIDGLVRSQILRGDRPGALTTLETYGDLAGEDWETDLLVSDPIAVQAYDHVRKLTLRSDTVSAARADLAGNGDLPPPVREVAAELLDRAEDANLYHLFAWLFARTPGLDARQCERAEAWARRAWELQQTTRHRLTLAAVLYRAGKIDDALFELGAAAPNSALETLIHAALQCLCLFSREDVTGWRAYNQFVILAETPEFRHDHDVADLRREIESLEAAPPWR